MDQFSEQSEMSVRHMRSSIIGTDHDTMRCKSRVKKRKIWRQLASHGVSLECYSSLEDHDGGKRLTGMLSRKKRLKEYLLGNRWLLDIHFRALCLAQKPFKMYSSPFQQNQKQIQEYILYLFFLFFSPKKQVLSFSTQSPYTTFCMDDNGN